MYTYESRLPAYISTLSVPLLTGECDLSPVMQEDTVCVAMHPSSGGSVACIGLTSSASGLFVEGHGDSCTTYELRGDDMLRVCVDGKEFMVAADPRFDDGSFAHDLRAGVHALLTRLTEADPLDDMLGAPSYGRDTMLVRMALAHSLSAPLMREAQIQFGAQF